MAFFGRPPLLCVAFFTIAAILCTLAESEQIVMHLYIHQVASGAGTNQAIVSQGSTNGFGMTDASDWSILDKPPTDPRAKVHGRARGLHTKCTSQSGTDWFTTMNLEFKDESRYNGSTLAVTGTHPRSNEWSIVGGTGVFRMARGFVNYAADSIDLKNGQRLYKVDVHVVYGDTSGCNCNTKWSEPIADN